MIEGSVTVTSGRASAENLLRSSCKIPHILTHTSVNIRAPKMRLLAGRRDYLGCYRANSSEQPLGGASALQYSQYFTAYLVGRLFLPKEALNAGFLFLLNLGELTEEEQS